MPLTFGASSIVDPMDAGVAEAGLPLKFTQIGVRIFVASTDNGTEAITLFVTDTDGSTLFIQIAVSVRGTNDAFTRIYCNRKKLK